MFDNKISYHVLYRFRWVVCQLETLRRSVQRDVRGILSKLPKTLDETYERVLRDIHEDNKEHARRLLHCIAVAVRPLRVEELAEILTFDFDAAEGDIPKYHANWRWKDQEEAVLSTCSSLITIAEHDGGFHRPRWRVVQFSHFSVKEFLMSNRLETPIRDVSRYHILPEPAHIILAQACLGFLLHLDAHIDTKLVENFPLAKYAAEYWFVHARFQDVASHVKYGMRDLFDPHKSHFALWVAIHDADDYYKPFHYSGPYDPDFGLDESGPDDWGLHDSELDGSELDDSGLDDSEVDDSERIRRTRTPLYYSALCGFYDLAKHLSIKFPQHVNAIGGEDDFPLVAALSKSHFSVAELLLEHGGNVDVRGTGGRSPLHALLNCREDDPDNRGVRFLLERCANVNALDLAHNTPLYLVVCQDSFAMARILLENGADPNLRNKDGQTPLHALSKVDIRIRKTGRITCGVSDVYNRL
jgi:hypothetical protein